MKSSPAVEPRPSDGLEFGRSLRLWAISAIRSVLEVDETDPAALEALSDRVFDLEFAPLRNRLGDILPLVLLTETKVLLRDLRQLENVPGMLAATERIIRSL